MKKQICKDAILILIMGMLYMGIEILWRGYTDISMLFVGGLCSFLVGRLNEHPRFYDRKMWQQCVIGALITLNIEFVAGLILNVWLGLNIWDYSGMWGNIYGQVCITYFALWFLLMPLCIYVDDWLRHRLFEEERPISLFENFKNLITGK